MVSSARLYLHPVVCLAMVLGFTMAPPLRAQWHVVSQSGPVTLGNGALFVTRQVAASARAELKLVFFDSNRCSLRVIDQPSKSDARSLAEALRDSVAIAGCNGGYFTTEFAPLGLVIAEGKRTGRMERSTLLGGMLVVRKGRPVLLWRDEFVEQSGVTDLVQAGPRLVNGGLPVKGLEATKRRTRTFVATDCAGHWAIGLCDRVTLRELSDLLAADGIINEFDVERALNLDGGSSSGLWYRMADGREGYDREFATVRNFLAVVPRSR